MSSKPAYVTCPPKTDPIFKLGLGYNKKDIKGGKRYEQEAIYDGADYWFTAIDINEKSDLIDRLRETLDQVHDMVQNGCHHENILEQVKWRI